MKHKITVIISSLLLIFNFTSIAFAKTEKQFKVNAKNAIAIDGATNEILFEQNADKIVKIASTTKIVTALVTIERGNLDRVYTISKNAASVRGSKVGYKAGENITVRELLYGLMFKSGNDAAITIAEGTSGSVEEFSKLMNHFANSIGITDSHFITPHGLDITDHYSSAYDLAILTSKGMKSEIFREIVGSKSITKDKYKFTRDYNNINKILYMIEGANGVKTGYTGEAGKCLVSSFDHRGRDIIIVVLNCPDRWKVTEKILDYVKENSVY